MSHLNSQNTYRLAGFSNPVTLTDVEYTIESIKSIVPDTAFKPITVTDHGKIVEVSVDDLLRDLLREYGSDILLSLFPNTISGLKLVMTRAIWAARNFSEYGVKSATAVGEVIKTHIHGDYGIYLAMIRASQPFQCFPTLIEVPSNNGSYTSNTPAAARYTDMLLPPFTRALFYDGVNIDGIKMRKSQALGELEPAYLVPAIPTTLTLGNSSIGYGFGSWVPARNLGEICDLAHAYCKHKSTSDAIRPFDIQQHAAKLLPDFPIRVILKNVPELLEAYKKGKFNAKIEMEGVVILSHDSIIIKTLPYGRDFDALRRLKEAIIANKNGWFAQSIDGEPLEEDDVNTNDPHTAPGVLIKFKRNINIFDALEVVGKEIGLTGSFSPNLLYVDDKGFVYEPTPTELLEIWFRERCGLIEGTKRREIQRIGGLINANNAYQKIVDHTDEVLKIIRNSNDRESGIATLSDRFDLSWSQGSIIMASKLETLTKNSPLLLKEQRVKLDDQMAVIVDSLTKIGNEMAETALQIKRKYRYDRISIIPKYIGYVSIDNYGAIQFSKPDEIETIIERFPKSDIRIYFYEGSNVFHVNDGKLSHNVNSKHLIGDIYGLAFTDRNAYTVNIDDGAGCSVKGIVPGSRKNGYFYTTEKSIAVRRHGAIDVINVPEEISLRKTICRGAATNISYVYPYTEAPHYIVTFNDATKNIVWLQRVVVPSAKPQKIPTESRGQLYVNHHTTGINWYFGIPSSCLNRINSKAFLITDAESLLDGNDRVQLDLGVSKMKSHPYFKMI